MRLHLWQRLFLAFALLSGLALAGFVAWQQQSFRRGFLNYLDDVALQRLSPAATRLGAAYVEHGGWDWLRDDPGRFGEYIEGRDERPYREDPRRDAAGDASPEPARGPADDSPPAPPLASPRPPDAGFPPQDRPPPRNDASAGAANRAPPPEARDPDRPPPPGAPPRNRDRPPPFGNGDRPPPPRPGEPPDFVDRRRAEPPRGERPWDAPRDPAAPPPPPPRPHGPPDLMPRLLLVGLAEERVAGNPRVPPGAAALPILAQGQRVGTLRLAPMPQLSGATDLAFAASQRNSALIAAAAILLGALLLAFTLARWLLAPVRALAAGTRALAAGDFARRIASTRQDELGALSRDFDHLAATLEQHRDARRQWGADIAHELRTPLSILRGEIQALQDGLRQPTPQALDSLQAECARLGGLIDDLYQLALADAGALEYRFETLDFSALVQESVELQRAASSDDGLALEADIAPGVRVRGDARRLAQLIDNLLANARRYTQAPGRIRVTLRRAERHACLRVDDTPPGVPPAALPQLFDRLFRVDSARTRAAGGAGLGLAICRAIAAAHDGRIGADASPLGGLRVTFELPLEIA